MRRTLRNLQKCGKNMLWMKVLHLPVAIPTKVDVTCQKEKVFYSLSLHPSSEVKGKEFLSFLYLSVCSEVLLIRANFAMAFNDQ